MYSGKIKIFLVLISFFGTLIFNAQTPSDDLILMNKKLTSLNTYDITMLVKVFQKNNVSTPAFETIGRTIKYENSFYLNILDRKTIVNGDLMLVIDDRQKMLLYNTITKEQMQKMSFQNTINIDSIIKSNKAVIKYVENSPSVRIIEVVILDNEISKIQISLNPKDYLINSIVYYYSSLGVKNTGNSKVAIYYSKFFQSSKNTELLELSKYVIRTNKKITATTAYKNYKLINAGAYANQ